MQSVFRRGRRAMGLALVGAFAALLWFVLSFSAASGATKSGHAKHGHKGGAVSISSEPWGTADGQAVSLWTLRSGNGMTVKITNYGGVVQSIWVPGRGGKVANVALGFPKLSDYVNDFTQTSANPWPAAGGSGNTYFGAIIGRYANRIANASFTLNGIGDMS